MAPAEASVPSSTSRPVQGDGQVLATVVVPGPRGSPPSRCLRAWIVCPGAPAALLVPRARVGGPADDVAGAYGPVTKAVQQEPRAGSARGCRVGRRRPARVFAGGFPPAALRTGRAHSCASGSPPVLCRGVRRPGTGDAGSPVAVAGHGDPAGSEELDSVVPDAPPGQEPAVDGVLVQAGVALVEPAEYSPEGEVVDVAERALGDPVLEIGAPASDRRVEFCAGGRRVSDEPSCGSGSGSCR